MRKTEQKADQVAKPHIKHWSDAKQDQMADEVASGKCTVLGDEVMPDYMVMRDQSAGKLYTPKKKR